MKYTKTTNDFGKEVVMCDNENGTISWIPCDESNSDYQAYLASLQAPTAQ